MPVEWTPERRAAQAAKMKDAHATRRGQLATSLDATSSPDTARGKVTQETAIVNPPATDDLVPSPVPSTPRAARPPRTARSSPATETATYPVDTLIHDIQSIPLDSISYADCGLLLNALAAASTAIAAARRQKQESLDAGTHCAPCSTCGRMIDISKSGGFQILTVRDEHWQPKNVYFCSQNCLLARNMPSHAETERLKKQRKAENRA